MAFQVRLILNHIYSRISNQLLMVIIASSAHCFLSKFQVAMSIISGWFDASLTQYIS
jgi:hypothetical protein